MKIPVGLVNLGTRISTNSPTLLIIGGVVAGAIALGLGVKATIKAKELIEDIESEEEIELTPMEIIKEVAPLYIPAGGMALIALGCVIGSNRIMLRRNAILAGLLGVSERRLNNYRKKVIERLGEPVHRDIEREILRDNVQNLPRVKHSNELVNCWDPYGGRAFVAKVSDLHKACAKINTGLFNQIRVRLNEWYDEIGLAPTIMGDAYWTTDDLPLSLNTDTAVNIDDIPYIQVEFNVGPGQRYLY